MFENKLHGVTPEMRETTDKLIRDYLGNIPNGAELHWVVSKVSTNEVFREMFYHAEMMQVKCYILGRLIEVARFTTDF